MINGHGDDSYKYSRPIELNFSSNVYTRINLQPLWEHLAKQLEPDAERSTNLLSSYPEPEPYALERALAKRLGLQAEEVMVTNGATEAIYLLAQTFRESQTAILQPTFSEYADACRMHGHAVSALYQLPTEAEAWRLPADIRMLWLCNPNNPTGSVVELDTLRAIIEANPRVLFVVDQSYESFTEAPLLSAAEAAELSNVVVLHSLTKRYALPGLRLGYATAGKHLIEQLRAHRMPWSVNALAIEAGLFLCAHPNVAQLPLGECLAEARALALALERTGAIEVWPTETHYMLCRLKYGRAAALKDYLAQERGILIRDASNFNGLGEQYFRVASQGEVADKQLVLAITDWLMN